MCELLAMSSARPARLTFSLHALASRGAAAGGTHDGWGVAFCEGTDVALFREPAAAGDSALVRHLESHGPSTTLAISHIRRVTRGAVQLSNTQPFVRELGGRMQVFAHNGDLPGIEHSEVFTLGACPPYRPYRSVGQTDSEHAWCALLARLSGLWAGAGVPTLESRLAWVAAFAADLRALGPANFLYADGDVLFAHGHRRIQHPGGRIEPPGLWMLQRRCAQDAPRPADVGGISVAGGDQTVLLFASVPLTDEAWQPLAAGELVAVRDGEILATQQPAVA